jgi:hypothetical protein
MAGVFSKGSVPTWPVGERCGDPDGQPTCKTDLRGIRCRIDRVGRTDDEQRIAVRGRTHGRLDGDIAAGPRPVVDDELLAESF